MSRSKQQAKLAVAAVGPQVGRLEQGAGDQVLGRGALVRRLGPVPEAVSRRRAQRLADGSAPPRPALAPRFERRPARHRGAVLALTQR